MNIYEKSDIDNRFNTLIDAIESREADQLILRTLGGSLSVSIQTRIDQLKNGTAKSNNLEFELTRLESAMKCLNFKINTGTVDSISKDILAAHKAYSVQ